jgi:hypothetical protein
VLNILQLSPVITVTEAKNEMHISLSAGMTRWFLLPQQSVKV